MRRWIFTVVSILAIASVMCTSVDFYYSKYCPHCARVHPVLKQLSAQYGFTLNEIMIEENRDAWVEMIHKYGLDGILRLKSPEGKDVFLFIEVGTPTMVVDNKYIIIGEFIDRIYRDINISHTCIEYIYGGKRLYLCPPLESVFLKLIKNESIPTVHAEWWDARDANNYLMSRFSKEDCSLKTSYGVRYIECTKGNESATIMESFAYFFFLKAYESGMIPIQNISTKQLITQQPQKSKRSLPAILLLGITLGLSDGIFNPCTISVIILLITFLISKGASKRRVLLCGIGFALGVFLVYFAFLVSLTLFFQRLPARFETLAGDVLGVLLLIFGAIEIKDYFAYGKGISLKIPEPAKKRFAAFLQAQNPFMSFVLGILAGAAEIPCAGIYPPAYARAVALYSWGNVVEALALVTWYMFFFVAPLIFIVLTIYFGVVSSNKWETFYKEHRKEMRLISGVIMISLGVMMLTGVFASLVAGV